MQTIQDLEALIAKTQNSAVKTELQAQLQRMKLEQSAAGGSEVSKAILLMKDVLDKVNKGTSSGGSSVDKAQVEQLVKDMMSKAKISKDDLDDELKRYLTSSVKVQVDLTTPNLNKSTGAAVNAAEYERPLFQKMLCDLIAMNNIYLFGGAGTGKTFIAGKLADFMGWKLYTINCNQYTSPLDILGGQTVDGYQRGTLEMAWGNIDTEGNPIPESGAILLLDELPKIDPNTAGILNAALADVKNYKAGGIAPTIKNGKGEIVSKANLCIIGTGNVKLNETSTEYEANFKQDLSLQDRFVGATYEVGTDYEYEANVIMKDVLFLWIALIKLREKIVEMRWTGQAFVSLRIMITLRDTYLTYRKIVDHKFPDSKKDLVDKINKPKTLKQGLDSFLNLFKEDQIDQLKDAMGYNMFIKTIEKKNTMSIDALTVQSELDEAKILIDANKAKLESKIA